MPPLDSEPFVDDDEDEPFIENIPNASKWQILKNFNREHLMVLQVRFIRLSVELLKYTHK